MQLFAWRISSIDFTAHTRRLVISYCDIAHAEWGIERFVFICMMRIR